MLVSNCWYPTPSSYGEMESGDPRKKSRRKESYLRIKEFLTCVPVSIIYVIVIEVRFILSYASSMYGKWLNDIPYLEIGLRYY